MKSLDIKFFHDMSLFHPLYPKAIDTNMFASNARGHYHMDYGNRCITRIFDIKRWFSDCSTLWIKV